MKVTALIENTSTIDELRHEHGLSLYITADDRHYLLDTGASSNFIANAKELGVSLQELDAVIISHNHSDHIGGLTALFEINPTVKVYLSRQAQGSFFLGTGLFKMRISAGRSFFERHADRFVWVDDELALTDRVSLWAVKDRDEQFVCQDKRLMMKRGMRTIPDTFEHEIFMTVREDNGVSILSSCSHNGIVNIIAQTARLFPGTPIKAVFGGFHMKGAGGLDTLNCSPDYIAQVAAKCKEYSVAKIYTGHCTGQKAFELLDSHLGDTIDYLSTGLTFTV